ncbi:type IV pilus assembly protein PilM [Deferribacter desulfuricans SSM1]|uniref:Type IV pilus assembly protein PilM n=1 Tax=Deferribacter desulfuricans (strain DSM 14783 / JCM 11476 / NBRC 101012 / SSM1) TaxID=639282 RepID=D3P8Z3_DEFDS|nr:type IV pilus assembly protein PilM [Deferribacter desulfuricans]BAI81183.1 type IV pilus assembly protein PilM [Deferribacter desulfuricans SSM1]
MFKKRNVIGIDIGSNTVKMVELKSKKGGYELVKAVIEELPEDAISEGSIVDYGEVINTVVEAFKRGKFSHKYVGVALKGNDVIAKRLQVNVPDKKNFDETFRWDAEQYIQMNIEDVNLDYEIIEFNDEIGQAEVILAVARKDLISDVSSVIESAKLKLSIIDLEIFTLINCFEMNYGREDGVNLIVNVGHATTLLVYIKNGLYEFSRTIDFGVKQCIEEIQKNHGLIYEDAKAKLLDKENIEFDDELRRSVEQFNEKLANEIRNSMNYFYTTTQLVVDKVFICGGGANVFQLKDTIEKVTEVEVAMFNPFANFDISKQIDQDLLTKHLYQFNVACGLSLRRVDEK